MPNALLDDIKDEDYTHSLASGNLGPKKQQKQDWNDENSWQSKGYFAAVRVCVCTGCGSITRELTGIFHQEVTPSGASRALALNLHHLNIPLQPLKPVTFMSSSTPICAECFEAHGFSLDLKAR